MRFLFFFGIVLAILGLIAITICIFLVWHDRKTQLGDDQFRGRLNKFVIINMIAFMLAMLGALCAVIALLFT